jgi:hypothetical protein
MAKIRAATLKTLEFYNFKDDNGEPIHWYPGQLEIIDCILHRESIDGKRRVEIIALTQYGKSLAVAAGILCRVVPRAEKWAIVAGTQEKAQIIMDYVIMMATNSALVRTQLKVSEPLDRLRMSKSKSRIMFSKKGEVRVYSAESARVNKVSKALMGFGSPNVIEDESALINDRLQSTVTRMLGANPHDNFMVKIGNPFERNHFLRTWRSPRYARIFIDYKRAIREGRMTEEFIEEQREEDPLMFDINYACKFPPASAIDTSGWMYLFSDEAIKKAIDRDLQPKGTRRLGIDVARGGRDSNVIVLRMDNYAKVIKKFQLQTRNKGGKDTLIMVADEIMNAMRTYHVQPENTFIDDGGVGGGVTDYLDTVHGVEINPVNFGEKASDHNRTAKCPNGNQDRFANLRAEIYASDIGLYNWLKHGGKLDNNAGWYEATNIRYRKDFKGRILLEPKDDMRSRGLNSPDILDALATTFAESSRNVYYGVNNETIKQGGVTYL